MAERTRFLIQKRTSLKSQITSLTNLFEKQALDNTALKLRLARLTTLYNAFEEYNDELAISDPDEAHQVEFTQIQDRFYALAGRIENFLNRADTSNASTSGTNNDVRSESVNSTTTIRMRRIKLPEAPLPTFDGRYENWLSFKNAFHNVIGSQTDLSEIDKLHYLKAALIGDAANKVKVFSVDGINYTKAWDLLERAYEVKRLLVSRHLSMIINAPVLEKETSNGLTKLADEIQQHLASLNSLGITVGSEMIIHLIESKLPRQTTEKWEVNLERDEMPTLDKLYEFLYRTAVTASKRERSKIPDTEKGKFEPSAKRRKIHPANQSFIVDTSRNCVVCKNKQHPLFVCDTFKQMPVQKRIDTIKKARLCYNCLRSHRNRPCGYSTCPRCHKRHNTLLHIDNYSNSIKTDIKQSDSERQA
ncbi:uncharacterized protein [Cardiocondyla obscurior]|uniref:uncharacterized protein n=1 Tax=Cardiocondyla obscurior TaxID=286306 RepID=UPI0039658511